MQPTASQKMTGGKIAVSVSLSRLLAPMLQMKADYLLNDKAIVGVLFATGSPARIGLSEYSQYELGIHGGYFAVGNVRRGLGVVAQMRGYSSSGKQEKSDNGPEITADGAGFSASGFATGRLQLRSGLLLQADGGLIWLYTTGTATTDGKTTKVSGKALGMLFNLWVGLSF